MRGKLDSVLHDHCSPRHGALWGGQVQVRRPRPPDEGGGDTLATFRGDGDRPVRSLGHSIKARRMKTGADSADGGVAIGNPLNRQLYGFSGAGTERLTLPELWHRST